jgi:hypothetical protein
MFMHQRHDKLRTGVHEQPDPITGRAECRELSGATLSVGQKLRPSERGLCTIDIAGVEKPKGEGAGLGRRMRLKFVDERTTGHGQPLLRHQGL